MNDANQWDELDLLFQRAKNKLVNPKNSLVNRRNFFLKLNEVFKDLNIQYFLTQESRYLFTHSIKNKVVPEDNIVIFQKNFDILLQNLNTLHSFDIVPVIKSPEFWYLRKNENIVKIKLSFVDEDEFSGKLRRVKYNDTYFLVSKSKINIFKSFNKQVKQFINNLLLFFKNLKSNYISYNDFLMLNIELENSKSWSLRKKHLDLVTNYSKLQKIGEIINFFESENLEEFFNKVIESDTSMKFEEPIHANKFFWNSGNNYFIYPIVYEFRKNVVPYKEANKYIEKNNKFMLYSKSYYEHLDSMSDSEIETFLKAHPIEIKDGSIVSGKHRSFAMIGRIIKGKNYLKMKVRYV